MTTTLCAEEGTATLPSEANRMPVLLVSSFADADRAASGQHPLRHNGDG
jgi:hypothetical protein